jgi:RNA polymerase sigma factor (sigma-70 family)
MLTNALVISRLLIAERPSLLRLIARITGNPAAAEDVAQSLWLRAQRIADDPPIVHQRAYLYRLATNLAIDHLKGEARRSDVEVEAQALLWGCDEALAAERVVIAHDTLARVEAAARALPEQTRRIFELHRHEGLSQRAVAERLGVSTTTVEKHMRRAMQALARARDGE